MRFLIDEQLPLALSDWLRWKGHQSDHVIQIGLEGAGDMAIAAAAAASEAVLVTKDFDFIHLRIPDLRIIWVRLGNVRTPVLVGAFSRAWPEVLDRLEAGEPVVEIS